MDFLGVCICLDGVADDEPVDLVDPAMDRVEVAGAFEVALAQSTVELLDACVGRGEV